MERELNDYIEEFRRGEYASFPLFYEATHRKVYYIAYGLLGSEFDAKDVSQDTYVRFISSLSSYRSGSNPYALLATIARNLAYDLLEKRNRLTSFEEEIGNEEEISRKEELSDSGEVKRLLQALSPGEREIVVLHVLDGLKFREIAPIVGKKLSTVLVTYNRAIKKMRGKEEGK